MSGSVIDALEEAVLAFKQRDFPPPAAIDLPRSLRPRLIYERHATGTATYIDLRADPAEDRFMDILIRWVP